MNNNLLGIITLLRSALNNEQLTLPADFDWNKAADILYEHHLIGVAVRGASRCGVSITNPAMRNMTALMCKDIAVCRRQTQQLQEIFSRFEAEGIEYMPFKGVVLKSLYPQPELRKMGDADILIRQSQYPAIKQILLSLGMTKEVESDHEYVWVCEDLKIELHKRLIPSYNKDYYAYYKDGWHLAKKNEQGTAYHLSDEDHFIYILVHFAKHYRDGSICAKNICDFWVYRQAHPDMDEDYLQEQLKKLDLLLFYQNVLTLLDFWFCGKEPTDIVLFMTENVFHGGIYTFEESQVVSAMLKQESNSNTERRRKLILQKIYPSLQTMENRYPILRKHAYLLPVFWFVRHMDLIFCRRSHMKKQMSALKTMSKDEERILEYEKKLQEVGLRFNFSE